MDKVTVCTLYSADSADSTERAILLKGKGNDEEVKWLAGTLIKLMRGLFKVYDVFCST